MSSEDTTFDSMPAFAAFTAEEVQRFTYDSKGKVRSFERVLPNGQKNQVDHLLIKQEGQEVWVPLGSTRLVRELKQLGPYQGQIDVTAHGDGTARQWTVTKVAAKAK